MRIVQRGCVSSSRSNLRALCSHELLLRRCRRPISSRFPFKSCGTPSMNFSFTRSTSLTKTSGANSMHLSAVRRRFGKHGIIGPRSIPCTASLSFRNVRPLEKGLRPPPYGPNRKPRSRILSGPKNRRPIFRCTPFRMLPTCLCSIRVCNSERISQSARVSGAGSNNGGENLAVLRTARILNAMS